MKAPALTVLAAALLAGCASTSSTAPRVVAQADPAQRAALFDRVKDLEGTWEMNDETGNRIVGTVYTVSSGGSVVREIMFPGTDHEMTNVYHMDGPTLVMTHYCALGNQPRLRAVAADPAGPIRFTTDSVTNYTARAQPYMGQLTLVMTGKDSLRQEWKSFNMGPQGHDATFDLTRKN